MCKKKIALIYAFSKGLRFKEYFVVWRIIEQFRLRGYSAGKNSVEYIFYICNRHFQLGVISTTRCTFSLACARH